MLLSTERAVDAGGTSSSGTFRRGLAWIRQASSLLTNSALA